MQSLDGAIGAVDGIRLLWSQIPFIREEDPQKLLFYKNRWAFNVLVIADHEKNIIDFEVGSHGGSHDSFVMLHSSFSKNRNDRLGERQFVLGDDDFFLDNKVMIPFEDQEEANLGHSNFNLAHSRGQTVVRNVLVDLKNRFPNLQAKNFHEKSTAVEAIVSCLLLHNVLNRSGDRPDFKEAQETAETERIIELLNGPPFGQNIDIDAASEEEGRAFRNRIASLEYGGVCQTLIVV